MSLSCYNCGKEVPENNIGRQDSCEHCGKDTRCCRNCVHFDKTRNNECREEQAMRQVDKEKGNFCDWFKARSGAVNSSGSSKTDLKSAADALFKKK